MMLENDFKLDSIVSSVDPIPEPSLVALNAGSAIFLGWHVLRRRPRSAQQLFLRQPPITTPDDIQR